MNMRRFPIHYLGIRSSHGHPIPDGRRKDQCTTSTSLSWPGLCNCPQTDILKPDDTNETSTPDTRHSVFPSRPNGIFGTQAIGGMRLVGYKQIGCLKRAYLSVDIIKPSILRGYLSCERQAHLPFREIQANANARQRFWCCSAPVSNQ